LVTSSSFHYIILQDGMMTWADYTVRSTHMNTTLLSNTTLLNACTWTTIRLNFIHDEILQIINIMHLCLIFSSKVIIYLYNEKIYIART